MPAHATTPQPFLVFSQRAEARVEVHDLDAYARRFFAAGVDEVDGTLVVTPEDGRRIERRVDGRPRRTADIELAREAERRNGGGLGGLAERCTVVWSVDGGPREEETLLVCAILAGVFLGPILDPRGPELLGVKSARERMARARS